MAKQKLKKKRSAKRKAGVKVVVNEFALMSRDVILGLLVLLLLFLSYK